MNRAFFEEVLKNPQKSYSDTIFDDQENIIWIDWREQENTIVEYIRDRILDADLACELKDVDNDIGYEVTISRGNKKHTVAQADGKSTQHETLIAINDLLGDNFEIRYVADTNGSDTAGIVVGAKTEWREIYQKFGRRLNEHFVPISVLPDLFHSPANQIDKAMERYAESIG